MRKITLKKKRDLYLTYAIALAIGLSLVAYVVYLLISSYTSQTELQKNLVNQLKQESETRAASIDYFLSERRDDVVNLALSREISGFFENKALGMSMEYGLNLSLIPIRELFIHLMERKQVGKDKIYSRIVLIERDGSILVDVSGEDQPVSGAKKWKPLLIPEHKNGFITTSHDRKEFLASVSYYHKDQYAGQIVAWIRPEIVDKHLLKEKAPGTRLMFLVTQEGDHFLLIGAAPSSLPLNLPELQSLAIAEIKTFETRNNDSVSKKRIALRIPMREVPFSLVCIVDARDAFGELNPDQLLINMAIQASVIFAGVFFIFGLTVRELILQTRLEDSTIRERDTGEKKRQLEIEITDRKRAEEELRRNHDVTERLVQEIAIISEIGKVIGSTLDTEEVYERFAVEARKLIPSDRVSVHLINPDEKSFTNAYVSGFDVPGRKPSTIVPLAGSVSEIFMQRQSGRIIHVESPEDLVRQFPGVTVSLVVQAGIRSLIGVPLIYRNEVIGSLHFRSKTPNAYTEQDLRLAERIGEQIAGAIANAQLYAGLKKTEEELKESEQRYRELSIVDDLTQLYNSRHFYVQLKNELDRSNRYEQPLTLLLLDLDNFKTFNDTYGHVEGDQVLWRLGRVVKRCLRETDFAYRYGGEEFTILLPMTTSANGAVTAERIRAEFKKELFTPVPDRDVHVTVSIGLAQYKRQEEMKVFVHRVDQLMYQGKKNGKDRVCCESETASCYT